MAIEYEGLAFERLGHASVRIETKDGIVAYIDPYGAMFDGAEPRDADVVFVTHDDPDHYDTAGIEAVCREDTTLAVYEKVDTSDLSREVIPLAADEETEIEGIGVRTVRAHNDPAGEHVDDDGNPFHAEGEVIGLLLDFDGTEVYFPSDTDFLDSLRDVRADVFLPPIGGYYTMDRHEAAEFAESVGAELVLPVHYDTFESIETDSGAFKREVEETGARVELF